ncbi:MAG: hypothetical protein AAGE52_15175 [Myxococcota bacterium]
MRFEPRDDGYFTDRQTQLVVELPELGRPFIERAAIRGTARRVMELDDPRVAKVVSLDPVAVEWGEFNGKLNAAVWADVGLELLDVASLLASVGARLSSFWIAGEGSVRASVHWWMDAEGSQPVYVDWPWVAWEIANRLRTQSSGRRKTRALRTALKEALNDEIEGVFRRHASESNPQRAIPARTPVRTDVDFDAAIQLGEAELKRATRETTTQVKRQLGACYHHRACVRYSAEPELAIRDVERAIELDPHTRYLTTRALWAAEDDALQWLGRAIAAILLPPWGTQEDLPFGEDSVDQAHRDASRAYQSRAALHARRDRGSEAAEDLDRAVQHEKARFGWAGEAARVRTLETRRDSLRG